MDSEGSMQIGGEKVLGKPEELIDFGYYFKNLKPKEIRNALNNFKNEVAENTRMFKQQCLNQKEIGSTKTTPTR